MSEQYKLIRTTQYNDIQSKISNVLGTGSNDYGYGQPVLSSQIALGAKISSNQWQNLRTDILKVRQHQSGITETLFLPSKDSIITDAHRQSYIDMANLCETNRTIIPPDSQATRSTLIEGIWTTPWQLSIAQTVTITFSSVEHMRYFFNTGGFFDIITSKTGGTNDDINNSWNNLLNSIGKIRFGRVNTTRIDNQNNTTIESAVGYTGLTTTYQQIYTTKSSNNLNQYTVSVKISGNEIIFGISFIDSSTVGNQNIDGTIVSKIDIYRASGNNVSIQIPGVSQRIMSGGSYSINVAGTYQWVVPDNVVGVTFSIAGAGGGKGGNDSLSGLPGHPGNKVTGNVTVTPGQVYTIKIGSRGGQGWNGRGTGGASGGTIGVSAGGYGGNAGHDGSSGGGGGGGASSGIYINNALVVVAGGGGGGGGAGQIYRTGIGGMVNGAGTYTPPNYSTGTGGTGHCLIYGGSGHQDDGGGGGGGGGGYPGCTTGGQGGLAVRGDYNANDGDQGANLLPAGFSAISNGGGNSYADGWVSIIWGASI